MGSTCRPDAELNTSGSCRIIRGSVDNSVRLLDSSHCCAINHPSELILLPINLQKLFEGSVLHHRPRLRNLTVYVWKFE
jgi:hypothetical protein